MIFLVFQEAAIPLPPPPRDGWDSRNHVSRDYLAFCAVEDREVLINRYISTMPKTLGIIPNSTKTPDEFIYELAQNKDKNNKLFYDYIKKIRKDG